MGARRLGATAKEGALLLRTLNTFIANFSAASATGLCVVRKRTVEQARLNLPLWLSDVLRKQRPSDVCNRELSGSIIASDASVSVGMDRQGGGSVGWEVGHVSIIPKID